MEWPDFNWKFASHVFYNHKLETVFFYVVVIVRRRVNFSTDECNVCIRIRFVYTFLFPANGALSDCAAYAVGIHLKLKAFFNDRKNGWTILMTK